MVPHVKVDTSFKGGGRELSDTVFRVYVQLGLYVNKAGLCWPKIHTLAIGCVKSDRAVQMAIRKLCSLGLVDIVQHGGRWPKDPNTYRINRYISFGTNSSSPIDNDKGEGGCTLEETKGETTCTHRVKLPAPIGVKSPHDRRRTSNKYNHIKIQLLKALRSLPEWGIDEGDEGWLSEFLQEFPALTEGDIKGCRDHHSEKKGKVDKGIWKNRLRNWMNFKGKNDGYRRSATARRDPGRGDRRAFTDYSDKPLR